VRIFKDLSAEVPDTNAHYFKLEEMNSSGNSILAYGYNSTYNPLFQLKSKEFQRKILLNNWIPCEFAQFKDHHGRSAFEMFDDFDEVYSICPYTTDWLNGKFKNSKFKNTFYPFNKDDIPDHQDKIYDVIYHGGIHGIEHINCLNAMRNFNYRYITMTNHINRLTQNHLGYATDINLSATEKLKTIAQTKISVCFNLIHNYPQHTSAIKSYEGWEKNVAFSEIDKLNIMPQFKSRVHEAAFSNSLILIKRDPWNLIENFYKPDEEFIYFDSDRELEEKIQEILSHWEDYQQIIDNAFKRTLNYTTEKMYNMVKDGESWNGIT